MNARIIMVKPINPERPGDGERRMVAYLSNSNGEISVCDISWEVLREIVGVGITSTFEALDTLQNEAIKRLQALISSGKIVAAKSETAKFPGGKNWLYETCIQDEDGTISTYFFQPYEYEKDAGLLAIFDALEILQNQAIELLNKRVIEMIVAEKLIPA